MSREVTCKLLDLATDGLLPWEDIARECLSYMSEADVADMATGPVGWVDEEDEADEEE